MIHQIKTSTNKILVELKVIDHGTEFYTSNELSTLRQKITEANKEHGLQFENDFSSLEGIKKELIEETFKDVSENWGLKYEIIIAGCQIFYAVKCEEKPNTGRVMEWHSADDGKVVENERPTKIYIAE